MKIHDNEVLGLIPARGGSKSIPEKNIVALADNPLITFVINAAKASDSIHRIICSTDDKKIAHVCKVHEIEVSERPDYLAQDSTNVLDVILDLLGKLEKEKAYLPWAVALLQPTSPFLLPGHIDRCIQLLRENPKANSSQTIARFPHNYHAYNQRISENGEVRFRFREERAACYNKQTKPVLHVFGNLVVTRSEALLKGRGIFAEPSMACEIPTPYALDLDGPEDLELAEWYIQAGKVILPHF